MGWPVLETLFGCGTAKILTYEYDRDYVRNLRTGQESIVQ